MRLSQKRVFAHSPLRPIVDDMIGSSGARTHDLLIKSPARYHQTTNQVLKCNRGNTFNLKSGKFVGTM